ncbi:MULTISPECIES: S9 family peptidase [Sphingobacterium]|jgi:dipeptidyl aminopeptidase/acylaminoacyl peptidase|uniref:Prolyl tripeptidyl peptidase n=2 Tax=Sphingobacterium multivorum TaxID=28454 RepID=A0A654DNE1_SPHMU|nr:MULTISPECIES: prolyl oligopeptidase family serine peptidase [Sphingobacterium]HAE69193.1 peptidase S9 [Sphingobacterium sp.]QQT46352.1 S9 family peptidase [Sphingobacterium multivorum]QQT61105.1 S9 family peptidase [Sphingobacterium multivorum]SUJ32131.1 Prolyl tripeptidyl peptidase precursor [Sphingobacterium multivorum]VXD07471.1 Prolyl tripeptidyl peptidase [Sphingobacterium multivorum]
MNKKSICIPFCFLAAFAAHAQKKPLDHTVYDSWQSVSSPYISKSGKFILFQVVPQEGDNQLFLKTKENKEIIQIPRGYNGKLTDTENHLLSLVKAPFALTREAKIKKKKAEDLPKDSLAIYNVTTSSLVKFAQVKSYKIADQNNNFVSFLFDKEINEKPDSKTATDATQAKKGSDKKKKTVATLALYDLNSGDSVQFSSVDQYEWNKNGSKIVFSKKTDSKDSLSKESGVYLYEIATKKLKKISNGKGNYKNFKFDESGNQLAYLGDLSNEKALLKNYNLYYYANGIDTAQYLATKTSNGIPKDWAVSGDGDIRFSKNGEKLFFGIAPIPRVRDTTLVDFEHAKVDVWNWQDDYLQPMQLVNLKKDLARNFLAVTYPKYNRNIIPLTDQTFNSTALTPDGNEEYILARTDFGKRIASQWEGSTRDDIYLVSTKTGNKELILSNFSGNAILSPDAKYIVYFDQDKGSWNSYQVSSKKKTVLNDGIPASFADEENDMPTAAQGYGMAAWSPDFKGIYVNSRYDIWYFNLDGSNKSILTNGYGAASQTTFRYLPLKREEDREQATTLDYKKGGFLTSFDNKTKESGFYQFKGQHSDPKSLLVEAKTFRNISSSADQQTILYSKEDYMNSPNIYTNTIKFKDELQLSNINQQQANYNWGTAELVHWTTPEGNQAEGILYKPENFDPAKKYPIIAYFYEKLSDGLYTYQPPAPTPSRLNIPYFVSNEYLVFAPNISYKTGHPGKSAEEYINSGMRYLAQNAWVDSTKMGIQGQSWGGYQVAHLITRTNMYAAAWTGAPVVNMTSAYGGIRWQSGMSRQFQYEHTQSRIGKTLWEAPELYIENSPLFHLDKVKTPVVIMANDNDGAVPWYQGIEMFTALRRLNKPVWMLNYNGDEHNLILRQNRKDIQIREQQFFDHFLKGAPAPSWMKKGVPATEKGIDWGFEL